MALGPTTVGRRRRRCAPCAPKVDDYFARCRLAAIDPRAGVALNRAERGAVRRSRAQDLAAARAEVAAFPLARVEPRPAAAARATA